MNFIGIIPARYASTRFPGKPLALIAGKPMIQRVYEQAQKALDTVIVATDDERIMNCVQRFGGNAVMTSPNHSCGTNRCYEAYIKSPHAGKTGKTVSDDVIINIQGDEPFIDPIQIKLLQSCFPTEIATLVTPFKPSDGTDALFNPNSPKVVISGQTSKKALLFSRSVIPYYRGVAQDKWLEEAERRGTPFYRHIGMYAYRADILQQIVKLQPSVLEQTESLEQLRWLEAGYEIRVAITDKQTIGIDTPEDIKKAEQQCC
ncbi:MAG: 3-deoxy-manno-octulosonate cytidylyltransferase [Paludibacteraceae bacterium]|nr:3-deoxy-manno-octulosonate cytidylyltransferase [Paludibacteraceae bacterium]